MIRFATERWMAREYVRNVSAKRIFEVSGVTNEEDAIVTVADQQATFPNSTFPICPFLRAKVPTVTTLSLNFYAVQYDYAPGPQKDKQDPKDEPPTYQWLVESRTESFDKDVNGKLLINSAGDLYQPSQPRLVTMLGMIIARNESTFPIGKVNSYMNHYNSSTFMVRGYTVQPGQALCKTITQISERPIDSDYVRVRYLFSFHPGWTKNDDNVWDGFRLRLVDKGLNAWWTRDSVTKPGPIYLKDAGGNSGRVSRDVLLDGQGGVKDTTNYSDQATGSGVAAKNNGLPAYVKAEEDPAGYGFILNYENYKPASFSGLGIF